MCSSDLEGGTGADSLVGGTGDDSFQETDGGDALAGGDGNDVLTLYGKATGTTLAYTSFATFASASGLRVKEIEQFYFRGDNTTGNDNVNASAAVYADLRGYAGDDTLVGGVGNDYFEGGAGADSLVGGTGEIGRAHV